MEIRGIDISQHNGNFNLQQAKNEGYNFAIIKAGYTGWGDGVSKAKDQQFENNYTKAKAIGLPVGAYYFTIATNYQRGVDEANWFYNNCLKGKTFEYPVFIDVENDTGEKYYLKKAGKDATTQGVIGFCETMEKLGYYVGIYGSDISTFQDLVNLNQLNKYDKWVARYVGGKPSYVKEYGMWQDSDKRVVAGVTTDTNWAYKDYPAIIKGKGLNGFSKQSVSESTTVNPTPTKKSNEEIANEVINGAWGNGDDRRKRLTGAGYNYDDIQRIVNNRLGVSKPQNSAVYYTIKYGDNLTKIAKRFGTTVNAIARLNNIPDPDKIQAGKRIRVK